MITIARVYDHLPKTAGFRVLVDRLWPRGISKGEVDLWLKEVAPSNELRKWYGHDPDKWDEFRKRYSTELSEHPDEMDRLLELAAEGELVPLYASKEERLNNAAALKGFLEKRMK